MRRRYLIAGGLLLLLLSCSEKYVLDWKMAQLCKKDGGLTVYERIKLPADRFDSNGDIIPIRPIYANPEGRYGSEYKITESHLLLKKGSPERGQGMLERVEIRLSRVRDDKLMGKMIYYSRIGGDFIAYSHFSSKTCPNFGRGTSIESIFVKEE